MIYRNQNKGYIAGVAAGIAEGYDVPVSLIRALFVALSFLAGLGILFYMYLILIMDDQTGQTHLDFQ
ncbi:MAG: PspC domain-containing protein [Candidatus Doudnabacteria bacterium]|nr:PspC domain-containing protein [Candidatus Doudnabacteria bacterium]